MKIRPLSIAVAAAVSGLALVGTASPAQAPAWIVEGGGPPASLSYGVYTPTEAPLFEQAQFLWSGRNYCWYDFGWRGPGYYWCGYARRRGYGWGGPEGWHGWGHNRGYRGAGYRGGYHGWGGHGGYTHGGGYHGGGHGGYHGGGGGHAGGGRPGGGHGGDGRHHG